MTDGIHRAVYENNKGTRLLRECQYNAAVESFTTVLKILKPLAAIVEQMDLICFNDRTNDNGSIDGVPLPISFTNNTNNYDTNNDQDPTTTRRVTTTTDIAPQTPSPSDSSSKETTNNNLSPPPAQHDKLMCPHHSLSSTDNKFAQKQTHYVFRDPVMIPLESVPSAKDNVMMTDDFDHEEYEFSLYSPEFFSKFLMIVMYNLALTLHLHAQSLSLSNTSTKDARKLFVRSKKLYELAFEMQLDETCDVELLFTLALINNLGLVYHTLNETLRSQRCFENMFSTMMYLTVTNESQSIKEWDGLLSNVMNLLLKHSYEVTAPAA